MKVTEALKRPKKPAASGKITKKRTNWILWIAAMALVIYVIVTIADQNIRINNARAELAGLNEKISLQEIKIDELKEVADAVENDNFDKFNDYIEKKARLNGFVKEDEVVYITIAGD